MSWVVVIFEGGEDLWKQLQWGRIVMTMIKSFFALDLHYKLFFTPPDLHSYIDAIVVVSPQLHGQHFPSQLPKQPNKTKTCKFGFF